MHCDRFYPHHWLLEPQDIEKVELSRNIMHTKFWQIIIWCTLRDGIWNVVFSMFQNVFPKPIQRSHNSQLMKDDQNYLCCIDSLHRFFGIRVLSFKYSGNVHWKHGHFEKVICLWWKTRTVKSIVLSWTWSWQ